MIRRGGRHSGGRSHSFSGRRSVPHAAARAPRPFHRSGGRLRPYGSATPHYRYRYHRQPRYFKNYYYGGIGVPYNSYPYYDYYPDYVYGSDYETPRYPPKQWIGKTLVRIGKNPTPQDLKTDNYVMEANIPQPYLVLAPGMLSRDFISNRLTIYINYQSKITDVVYG